MLAPVFSQHPDFPSRNASLCAETAASVPSPSCHLESECWFLRGFVFQDPAYCLRRIDPGKPAGEAPATSGGCRLLCPSPSPVVALLAWGCSQDRPVTDLKPGSEGRAWPFPPHQLLDSNTTRDNRSLQGHKCCGKAPRSSYCWGFPVFSP